MRVINILLKVRVFILLLLIITQNCLSATFETNRVLKTYKLLPIDIKVKIDTLSTNKSIKWNDTTETNITVLFNNSNQISHIGVDLNKTKGINSEYIDAYHYVEFCLLNFILLNTENERLEFAKKMQLKFQLAGKPVDFNLKFMHSFIENLQKLEFSLTYNDFYFQARWVEQNGKQFTMQFPTVLNLLRGMDKADLELSFLRELKNNSESMVSNFKIKHEKVNRLGKKIYIQEGERFENDNFRSDIYLEKHGIPSEYHPTFSNLYPVESFSNLFVCNLENSFQVETTFRLYGKKINEKHSLKNIQNQLSNNNKVFFGIYATTSYSMKATIVYYNQIYKYIHMLVIEADNENVFRDKNSELKATLFLYIPRSEFDNDKINEKQTNL